MAAGRDVCDCCSYSALHGRLVKQSAVKRNRHPARKQEVKSVTICNHMIIYVEKLHTSHTKLLKLISKFSKVTVQKVSTQK
jgi:hypothetical protein